MFELTQRVQKHDKEGAPVISEPGVVVKELLWDSQILNNKHTGDIYVYSMTLLGARTYLAPFPCCTFCWLLFSRSIEPIDLI